MSREGVSEMGHRAASRGERCQTVREKGEKNICCCNRECRPRIPRVLRLHVGGSLVREVARHLTRRVPLISGTSPPPPERDRAASSQVRRLAPGAMLAPRVLAHRPTGLFCVRRQKASAAGGPSRGRAVALPRGTHRRSLVDPDGVTCVDLPSIAHDRWSVDAGDSSEQEKYKPKRATLPHPKHETKWQNRLLELRDFKAEHGHLIVPHKEPWKGLRNWVCHQRKLRRRRELSESRERALSELGLSWDPPRGRRTNRHSEARHKVCEDRWDSMFQRLCEFHAATGHFKVPRDDVKLFNWIHLQRQKHKRGKLLDARRELLTGVGVDLSTKAPASWSVRFEELRAFKDAHGHCSVPATWRQNTLLGGWVSRQRRYKRSGTLSEERTRALDSLGFDWERQSSYKTSKGSLHVRQKTSPWALRPREGASSPITESGGGASVQWMGMEEDETVNNVTAPLVNGWGKASSAYEEKQQFVFDRINEWWKSEDNDASGSRGRVRAMRYNYALKAKQGTIKPDIIIEVEEMTSGKIWGLIIEVDEFAHKRGKHYSWHAEEERMRDLQVTLGVPVKIVRFNPDPTSANPQDLEERTETLVKHIAEKFLAAAPQRELEVEYLLYD